MFNLHDALLLDKLEIALATFVIFLLILAVLLSIGGFFLP